jgi:hypothetical protein
MSTALRIGCVVVVAVALTGCESTVDRAKKLSAEGAAAFHQKGIQVGASDKQIHILGSQIIRDPNGTAVVIEVRNTGTKPVFDAPISIDVRDRAGHRVFENNTPGLEADLVHVPLVEPGHVFDWVNDQVLATGTPSKVQARIGDGRSPHGALPKIEISGLSLTHDPTSGYAASGRVTNRSKIDQIHLVLFAVARRSGSIVAAGRSIVARLRAGTHYEFHAYLTGNPTGAQISVVAPPSVL